MWLPLSRFPFVVVSRPSRQQVLEAELQANPGAEPEPNVLLFFF